MKTVHKFPLDTMGRQQVELPRGAEILTVQAQHNVPTIWAIVDPEAPKQTRTFAIYGTGHRMAELEMGAERKYIGTFQQLDGALVFHLFEET
jgi:hypothetical protein